MSVVAAISPGRQIVVAGSSSLLASYPELGEARGPLETSYDADLLIEGVDEQLAGVLAEAVGSESLFEARQGYHADALRPVITETFPLGWKERLIPLTGCETAQCLDPHDLGAIKVRTGRPKDLELCATLLASKRLDADVIYERLTQTHMTDRMRVLAGERFRKTLALAQSKVDQTDA